MRAVFVFGLSALAAAMASTTSAQTPSFTPVTIGSYPQEIANVYTQSDGLPSSDVYDVGVSAQGEIQCVTNNGLAGLNDGKWETVPLQAGDAPPVAAFTTDGSAVWADELVLTKGQLAKRGPLPVLPDKSLSVVTICLGRDKTYIGAKEGLFLAPTIADGLSRDPAAARSLLSSIKDTAGIEQTSSWAVAPCAALNGLLGSDPSIHDIAEGPDGEVAVAAAAGLFCRELGMETWRALCPREDATRSWAPYDVRADAYDSGGRLWFASPQGVGCRLAKLAPGVGGEEWKLYTGHEGLPYNDFTCMAAGPDGVMWFGTHRGAIRFDGVEWAYRQGLRWLPDDDVRDIAVLPNGDAYFATPKGLGVIAHKPMTLAEKARFFEDEIDARHRRTPYGYVQSIVLKRPGDKTEWSNRDDDNDGQYTGMYGAAECFAYAATKDPKAKERATKAFEALRFLWEVTQGGNPPALPGFVARTILPTDAPRNPNNERAYSLENDKKEQEGDHLWKVMHPRWPISADGKWYWKCDTSSDELDGHYFLYARYYDLVAETEQEKERVREVVRALTDHLVEHDLKLVDWDGKPTRWANFSPKSLNHDPQWWAERGLNSLSILAHLRAAAHITGDAKYDNVADTLIREHGYAQNCTFPKVQRGPGSFVQFDDEMAFMNYYNLLRYEKDPQLRQVFLNSCFQYWELEECERNSFFNFAYAACCQNETISTQWGDTSVSPKQSCLDAAVDTLKRYPLDRFNWRHTNSHRLDIVPLPAYRRDPGDAEGCGCRVDGTVVPIDERNIHVWADDPWRLDTGGNGDALEDGAAFLLAYYMGLYHGFIEERRG